MGIQAQISGATAGSADNPLTQWLVIDAKQKYQQAIQKLGLDSQKLQGKHLSGFSVDDLNNEKRKVKNELKVYDQAFLSKFKRLPSRVEKEPMRNLYMYYKRLKQYITRKQANPDAGARANSNASGRTVGSALSGVSGVSG
jgi:predicted Mrr-cat superfamily restriction endonuclease